MQVRSSWGGVVRKVAELGAEDRSAIFTVGAFHGPPQELLGQAAGSAATGGPFGLLARARVAQWDSTSRSKFSPPARTPSTVRPGTALERKHSGASRIGLLRQYSRCPFRRAGEHLGVTGVVPDAPTCQPAAVQLGEFLQRDLARADGAPEMGATARDRLRGILAGGDSERIPHFVRRSTSTALLTTCAYSNASRSFGSRLRLTTADSGPTARKMGDRRNGCPSWEGGCETGLRRGWDLTRDRRRRSPRWRPARPRRTPTPGHPRPPRRCRSACRRTGSGCPARR